MIKLIHYFMKFVKEMKFIIISRSYRQKKLLQLSFC
ncbi:hypothetical protein L423_00026 [Enterobacter roggenkampii]|nr:hypothetical protein L423_00026 [Enterobacter roggenkampii]